MVSRTTGHVVDQQIANGAVRWNQVVDQSRTTPAMEADLSDHVWKAEELVGLLEA
jgi:hypothetical protein